MPVIMSGSFIYSNRFIHTKCVHLEERNQGATGRGDNPALSPAFRVRRGSQTLFGSTTRYIGSRASGYPPDLVPFRRCAGAPPPTASAIAGARRPGPHSSLGRSV